MSARHFPVTLMSDLPTRYIDAAAIDYFLIEAIDALRASAAVADARAKKIEIEMIDAHILPPPPPPKDHPPDDEDDALRVRLEAIGMHVGANFSERYASRLSLIPILTPRQTMQRQTSLHRNTRCYQIRLQRPLGCMLGETGG